MLEFARTVFGDEFDDDAVITESRVSVDEWVGPLAGRRARGPTARRSRRRWSMRRRCLMAGAIAEAVLACLFDGTHRLTSDRHRRRSCLALARAHPLTRTLAVHAEHARPIRDLVDDVLPAFAIDEPDRLIAENFLLIFSAALSHVRSAAGRGALSVDLHLWIRELTRIDRVAIGPPRYLWSDDGHLTTALDDVGGTDAPSFPAVYCRHCGRSGWAVLRAPVGGFDLHGRRRRRHPARSVR